MKNKNVDITDGEEVVFDFKTFELKGASHKLKFMYNIIFEEKGLYNVLFNMTNGISFATVSTTVISFILYIFIQ